MKKSKNVWLDSGMTGFHADCLPIEKNAEKRQASGQRSRVLSRLVNTHVRINKYYAPKNCDLSAFDWHSGALHKELSQDVAKYIRLIGKSH